MTSTAGNHAAAGVSHLKAGNSSLDAILTAVLNRRNPSIPCNSTWKTIYFSSVIIDWQYPTVLELAKKLASGHSTADAIASSCFEWVRDEIHHSCDYQMNPVTCRASDVLKYKTGYCYAKSHLLAALLRANRIPSGFCYQRFSIDGKGEPYSLHGFNAAYLPEVGWYRIDARGNREGVNAQFTPPQEQLAFRVQLPKEAEFQNIFPEPLPVVVEALQAYRTWDDLLAHLPDVSTKSSPELVPSSVVGSDRSQLETTLLF